MTRGRKTTPLLIAVCLSLAACAVAPQSGVTVDRASIAARKAKAEKLTRDGRLPEALVQWRLLETLDSGNSELTRKRRVLEARMRKKADAYFQKGKELKRRGRTKEARRELLAALSFDPSHEGAIEALRAIEVVQVRRARPKMADPKPRVTAVAKATPEPGAKKAAPATAPKAAKKQSEPANPSLERAMALAKQGKHAASLPHFERHLALHPTDKKAIVLLARSQREVGFALYKAGKLEDSLPHLEAFGRYNNGSDQAAAQALKDTKWRLAQSAYEKGVRIFQNDVDKAIGFWEQALNYDPSHLKARSYLVRGRKIQETLKSLSQ